MVTAKLFLLVCSSDIINFLQYELSNVPIWLMDETKLFPQKRKINANWKNLQTKSHILVVLHNLKKIHPNKSCRIPANIKNFAFFPRFPTFIKLNFRMNDRLPSHKNVSIAKYFLGWTNCANDLYCLKYLQQINDLVIHHFTNTVHTCVKNSIWILCLCFPAGLKVFFTIKAFMSVILWHKGNFVGFHLSF